MSILCYISDQFRKDATSHGVPSDKIQSLADDVEKRQSLAGFDHFPPPCLTKKKWAAYNNRVVAVEKLIGGNVVVILLRLLIRGGNDYAAFNRNPPEWAGKFFDEEFHDDRLERWVSDRTQKTPPPDAPLLSDTEQTFLWSVAYDDVGDDVVVCESHEWEASTKESRVQDRRVLIPEMILSAIDGSEGVVQTLRSPKDDRLTIQAIRLSQTSQCLLIRADYVATEQELAATTSRWQQHLATADSETVLRHSRRSYPWVCCDDDIWLEIQKDPQANLALSPEEAEILQLTTARASTAPSLPLFINGRAGSGKSTLLQYLFSQSFIRWGRSFLDGEGETSPIYFASSGELLAVAHDVVGSLLKAHHQQLLSSSDKDEHFIGALQECFQEFLRYMHRQLPESHHSQFEWTQYVSYARFRRMWMEKFGQDRTAVQKYGPQISWHVIRGLIKGMSVDAILSKDDFEDLPEDERTVSKEVYNMVYDRVWTAWYEPLCRNGDCWDSQDLVRLLLDNDCLRSTHCSVFCDEAQDFTRLELESIYRCSLFSSRQIDYQSVRRVPFVFAGDPFQTLNPTGFRWETVRAAFTERILRSLYRFNSREEVPQLSYRELTFNYRSSLRLVHFCNSIQATRACLFDHRSLRPQSTWQLGQDASPPAFFEKGDPQLEQALRDQSDLVLIVPCEEGEEVEFVERDEYLRKFVQLDEAGTPRNVLSAARAKGLEFLRVALYGWSKRTEASLLSSLLQSPAARALSVDERLALGYFLNNLYVAASRARRRLFIVDEADSLNSLWWFATDESHLSKVIERIPSKESWSEHVGYLVRGVPENFSADRDNPKELALRFEREGISKEDSYLLRNAGHLYGNIGDTAKKNECRARADLLENNYSDAAKEFEQAGLVEESLSALWRGQLYADVASFAGRCSEIAKHPYTRMSSFLSGKDHAIRGCITLCDNLLANARANEVLRGELKDLSWGTAIGQALMKTVEGTKGVRSDDASTLAAKVVQLRSAGVSVAPNVLAKVFFLGSRYDEVLRVLKSDDGSEMYRHARALSLIERESSEQGSLQPNEARYVAEHYMHLKEFPKAAEYFRRSGDTERLLDCLRSIAGDGTSPEIGVLIKAAIDVLIDQGQWSLLVSLLTHGTPRPSKSGDWSKAAATNVLRKIQSDGVVIRHVVPRMAISDKLSNADVRLKNEVSEFLAAIFVRRESKASWWRELPWRIAGAAIERAGKDIDALEFYERWKGTTHLKSEREYADRRWVVCKLRQAKREEQQGLRNKANEHRREAERIAAVHNWEDRELADDFPAIDIEQADVVNPQSGPQESVIRTSHDGGTEGRVGAISWRLFPAKNWINLTSENDGMRARILLADKRVDSDDVEFVDGIPFEWRCEEWGLTVSWRSDSAVQIRHGSEKVEIPFGVLP